MASVDGDSTTFAGRVLCLVCLDEAEQEGLEWHTIPARVSVVVDGNSYCVQHYRVRVVSGHQEATH